MTEMTLIKWLLFLFIIATTDGWKRADSIGEEIMKTILESCYAKDSSPNPVVIFGEFNTHIDGVSIIRINDFLNLKDYEKYRSLKFKARSVVLMGEPPKRLSSHLQRLRRTKLWDNMVPFFIIGETTAPCTNSRVVLREMWKMEILNSIYICPNSINNGPEIYTLNPFTNYAPYPWQRIYKLNDLNIFYQNFDSNISCTHLTYDKTKILNGYDIVAVDWKYAGSGWVPGENYFEKYGKLMDISFRALRTIIEALNASGRIEVEIGFDSMMKHFIKGSADIMIPLYSLDSFRDYPYLFPLLRTEMVAVVKLRAEVSTLEKIRHLWSTPVLIAAAVALAVLFLVLMIKSRSFGVALLDITRLLTYTSIQIGNRYQAFRIYFTTMLIFMVISDGVFQGNIAAFLTTQEKGSAPESIHELVKLRYQMYTHQVTLAYAKESCPKCEFRGVSTYDECIELVLNGSKNLCVINKSHYESYYILLPLDRVKESLNPKLANFKCRQDWLLRDRFNDMMMRVVEAGLPDYWEMQLTRIPKAKRESMEAEWASAEYRPVALRKLDFAFKLLAAGLSLATIVFLLELCWARYVNP